MRMVKLSAIAFALLVMFGVAAVDLALGQAQDDLGAGWEAPPSDFASPPAGSTASGGAAPGTGLLPIVQEIQVDGTAGAEAGVGRWLPWVLAGVLVFLLLLMFVLMLVMLAMKSSQSKKVVAAMRAEQQRRDAEMMAQIQSIKASNERLTDENQGLQMQLSDVMEDNAELGPQHTRVYDKPALGLVLVDQRTARAETLALHKTDMKGNIVDTPKYLIGRSSDCHVCVSQESVSLQHCRIYAERDKTCYIFDLDSSNGTLLVRGETRIKVEGREELKNGDVMILGNERDKHAKFNAMIQEFDVNAPIS